MQHVFTKLSFRRALEKVGAPLAQFYTKGNEIPGGYVTPWGATQWELELDHKPLPTDQPLTPPGEQVPLYGDGQTL